MKYHGRGRPRKIVESSGATPELHRKHARGQTLAPLDCLLAAGVVDANAHWAGLHLRRLYVGLRGNGAPQSGFYWMARMGRGDVSDARLLQWQKEYSQAKEWLAEKGQWHACIALVLADDAGGQPLVAWEKGAEACRLLANRWCKKSM